MKFSGISQNTKNVFFKPGTFMFSIGKDIFSKYALDCRLKNRRILGLFNKFTGKKGISRFEPFNQSWMVGIRSKVVRGSSPSGTVPPDIVAPWLALRRSPELGKKRLESSIFHGKRTGTYRGPR